jgi:hypothetical protein
MESLEVEQLATGGVNGALTVDNNDTDKIALLIQGSNIDADVLDIQADAVTTAKGIDMSADSLTTGSALYLDSDSSSTSTRNIVEIIQNNASATSAVALKVQQDGDAPAAVFEGRINVRKGSAFQTLTTSSWVLGG